MLINYYLNAAYLLPHMAAYFLPQSASILPTYYLNAAYLLPQ
jgi:hypothetical protein